MSLMTAVDDFLEHSTTSTFRRDIGHAVQLGLPGIGEDMPMAPSRFRSQLADLGIGRRIKKRDFNREFSGVALSRLENPHQLMNPFKISPLRDSLSDVLEVPFVPRPGESNLFHKFGHYEEIPMAGLTSNQLTVVDERIAEILDNPSNAVNPRLPHERPLVMRVHPTEELLDKDLEAWDPDLIDKKRWAIPKPGVDQDIIWNGNHRAVAAKMQGQMFLNAQVIDTADLPKHQYDIMKTRDRLESAGKRQKPSAARRKMALDLMHQAQSAPPSSGRMGGVPTRSSSARAAHYRDF